MYTPTYTCLWLKNEIKSKHISLPDVHKLRCGFYGEEYSCCREASPVAETNTEQPNKRKSEEACDLYRLKREPIIYYNIINGEAAALGEFPHMAALGYLNVENKQQIDFNCGGSLVSDRYILTAAHCGDKLLPVIARLGSININNPDIDPETNGIAFDVNIESFKLHPDFTSNQRYHDIALILLDSVVRFHNNMHPACLNTELAENNSAEPELIATGWGVINYTTFERSDILMKTNLTSVDIKQCSAKTQFLVGRKFPLGVTKGQLCANDPTKMKDTCQGDSGGPLQFIDNTARKMPIIVGVTSFGMACGSRAPSIYTRVAVYIEWIESIVWSN